MTILWTEPSLDDLKATRNYIHTMERVGEASAFALDLERGRGTLILSLRGAQRRGNLKANLAIEN
ncbi:MAG: hypothetical protein FJ280_28510 [Planctomycetes bacterium]|nr:hypothetical protein [Planctomycetota bacterium]